MAKHGCPQEKWQVTVRRGNFSAFNGYHFTPSDYSEVVCSQCGARWRTKAAYVLQLKDEPGSPAERHAAQPAQPSALANRETARQQSPFRFGRPYDPICIVTKQAHEPREHDPARCRSCGLFIQKDEGDENQ